MGKTLETQHVRFREKKITAVSFIELLAYYDSVARAGSRITV